MADKDEKDEPTIAIDLVVTKYKMAAEIVNATMTRLVEKCVLSADVLELCDFGDNMLTEKCNSVFKKDKEMKKGIAFPTCVSVNNCIHHYSPLRSESTQTLKDGDLVKIDLGAHIDGFISVLAHTIVVGATKNKPATGRKADVVLAAHYAIEAAFRMMKSGETNVKIADTVQKIADAYHCKPVEGIVSHQLKRHVIDGEKTINLNPTDAQRKEHEKWEFQEHEVYALDVLISSGEGKGRCLEARTTVYKRNDIVYNLKMKFSRQFFSEVDKKFHTMPFTLRMMEDEKKAKMGVVECVNHELMTPYDVLYEREGEFVAQFKYTVLLMTNGPMKITCLERDLNTYKSEYSIDDKELKLLLSSNVKKSAKKKKVPPKGESENKGV